MTDSGGSKDNMDDLIKYPRTRHVRGSRLQKDDHDLETIPFSDLAGRRLVIEEKIDGSNCGISFIDGEMKLQSRGHYLTGGPREKQFNLFKQWASRHRDDFSEVLGKRYVMYGEWMFAKHTIFYDDLPHYFMEFDVYDKERKVFLDTFHRRALLSDLPIKSVLVLDTAEVKKLDELRAYIEASYFKTPESAQNLSIAALASGQDPEFVAKHTDMSPLMEGLYIKLEEDGIVKERCKFVRSDFTNSILEQAQHWHDRPIVQNKLRDGALELMFS